MLWIADCTPAIWPTQTCNELAAGTTYFFTTDIAALLMIFRNTCPIPIGPTPGDLFNRINWLTRRAFKLSWQSVSGNIAFLYFFFVFVKFYLIFLRQSPAPNFDRPAARFVLTTVFWIRSPVISSNTISCTSFGPCKSSMWYLGLASGFFMLSY